MKQLTINNLVLNVTEPNKARKGSNSVFRLYHVASTVHRYTVVCRVSGLQAPDAWQVMPGTLDYDKARELAYADTVQYACRTRKEAYEYIANKCIELNSQAIGLNF